MIEVIRRAEESFKSLLTPGILFEGLGFHYLGPVHGHKLERLIETFKNIKDWDGPILIHVITQKGKGYEFAEKDPASFHGVNPFDLKTGRPIASLKSAPSYTEVFADAILKLAKKDRKIIGITAAMPNGTGLDKFAKEFPERFYDVGIAEQHAVTFAAGLATEGLKPVTAIYSTFIQRAYDQILHDVCLQNLPVVFALDRGGIVGEDGPTHHGLFDFSYLRHIPNIIVMAPKDENELQHMLNTAIRCNMPASIRYPRGTGYGVSLDRDFKLLEIGKGEILLEGDALAIIAIGSTVYSAYEAGKRLREEGINITVVNSRFVKPLDTSLILKLAKKTGRIITVEENVLAGGFGSGVLECLEELGLTDVIVKRLGIPDKFVEHGSQKLLRKKYSIDAEGIYNTAKEILRFKTPRISKEDHLDDRLTEKILHRRLS